MSFLFVNVFVILLAGFAWILWRRWQDSEHRALTNSRLAQLGAGVDDIAHDLQNMCTAINMNLSVDAAARPEEVQEVLTDIRGSMDSVAALVWAIRGAAAPCNVEGGSVAGIVHLLSAVLRRDHARIEVEIREDCKFDGAYVDAFRVVENLLVNAVREAKAMEATRVRVVVNRSGFTVWNRVRDQAGLERALTTGVRSRSRSKGRGLAIAKLSASRLGWEVRHGFVDSEIAFTVERRVEATRAAALAGPTHYRQLP